MFPIGLRHRFEEYPKLRELIRLKDELIQARVTPPMYLRTDLRTFDLLDLKSVFDVILVEPPLDRSWSWEEVSNSQYFSFIGKDCLGDLGCHQLMNGIDAYGLMAFFICECLFGIFILLVRNCRARECSISLN